MKSPKRINMKTTYENKEVMDNDGSCFSPRSLFALPPDGGSLMLDSLHYVDESSDQDLLLHVPSNGSFPQAELLHPTSSFGQQASTSNSSRYPHLVRPWQSLKNQYFWSVGLYRFTFCRIPWLGYNLWMRFDGCCFFPFDNFKLWYAKGRIWMGLFFSFTLHFFYIFPSAALWNYRNKMQGLKLHEWLLKSQSLVHF